MHTLVAKWPTHGGGATDLSAVSRGVGHKQPSGRAITESSASVGTVADVTISYRFAEGVQRRAGGEILVGGAPKKVIRLSRGGALFLGTTGDDPGPIRASAPVQAELCRRLAASGFLVPILSGPAFEPAAPGLISPRRVSAVIPAFDDRDGVIETLSSLARHTPNIAAVWVVDDCSNPRLGHMEDGWPFDVQVIRRDRNGGPAAARNTGLSRVATPFVAFIDAGVEVSEGWLAPLLTMLVEGGASVVAPRIRPRFRAVHAGSAPAVAGGALRAEGGVEPPDRATSPTSALERYEDAAFPLDLGGRSAAVRQGGRIGYLPGTLLVCAVDTARAAGGFDESMRYGEDVDLVWRIEAAGETAPAVEPATRGATSTVAAAHPGGVAWYAADVVVTHPVRNTWAAAARQRFGYGTSAAMLERHHGERVRPAVVSPWAIAPWLIGAVNPLAGLVAAGAMAAAVWPQLPEFPPAGNIGPTVLDASRVERVTVGIGLGLGGQLAQAAGVSRAALRPWWPVLVAGAVASRRFRKVAVGLTTVALVDDVRRQKPSMNPLGWAAIRATDHAAYSAGVWMGAWRARSPAALLPSVKWTPISRRSTLG